jgi:hypothetical protein
MSRITLHAVVAGLVRRTWFVALMTVVVCAAFTAHALAALAEADKVVPVPSAHPHALVAKTSAPARKSPDGSGLVERNKFCSTCSAERGTSGSPDASFAGRPAMLIETSLGKEPRATVRVLDTEVQGSWGLGDAIPGVGTIIRIGGVSIDVVDGAGRHAKLSLLDSTAAGRRDAGAATPAPGPAANPFADRIKQLDDHTYEVDRALVRELVTGATKAGGARMVPVVTDGDVKGVRVFAVTPSSVPGAIGLRNGDLISGIDGDPIKSAQQLLDLYAKLDKVDAVDLQGTRAGKPLAISLRLK